MLGLGANKLGKHFPDGVARGWASYAVFAFPIFFLVLGLIYSDCMPPWGRQVDPESAYAMNGLAAADGYMFMKNDHPGTTTTL